MILLPPSLITACHKVWDGDHLTMGCYNGHKCEGWFFFFHVSNFEWLLHEAGIKQRLPVCLLIMRESSLAYVFLSIIKLKSE